MHGELLIHPVSTSNLKDNRTLLVLPAGLSDEELLGSITSRAASRYGEQTGNTTGLLSRYNNGGNETGLIVDYSGFRAAELKVFYNDLYQVSNYSDYNALSEVDKNSRLNRDGGSYRGTLYDLPIDLRFKGQISDLSAAASLTGQLFTKMVIGPIKFNTPPAKNIADLASDNLIDEVAGNIQKRIVDKLLNKSFIPDTFRLPSTINTGNKIFLYPRNTDYSITWKPLAPNLRERVFK